MAAAGKRLFRPIRSETILLVVLIPPDKGPEDRKSPASEKRMEI